MNIKGFSIDFSTTSVKFSFKTLIDEIKPVVAEKSQFGQGVILITSHFSEISHFGVCDTRHKTTEFSHEYTLTSRTILIAA